MNLLPLYHPEIPAFLAALADTPPMRRVAEVGMNCGCEYTSFPRFSNLQKYDRRVHSLGAALIVWHFTGSAEQAAATLFHDVATPVFAHSIDFLRGDYLTQESTEAGTGEILRGCPEITGLLGQIGLSADGVADYHRYPIADNDPPRLSADRLEYTLGNLVNFGFRTEADVRRHYGAVCVGENEEGAPELCFWDLPAAKRFAMDAMKCARIYVADEDRYAMQRAAEVIALAFSRGVLSEEDLYTTEPEVIAKLLSDELSDEGTAAAWRAFRALSKMAEPGDPAAQGAWRVIPAKRRHIDPFVRDRGRLSRLDAEFAEEKRRFLMLDQTRPIAGIP